MKRIFFPPIQNMRAVVRILLVLLMAVGLFLSAPASPVRADSPMTITVNSNADNALVGDSNCTLREAINNSTTNADTSGGDCVAGSPTYGDTIIFSSSLGTTIITLSSTLPVILGDLTIDGENRITISGNDSVQVFRVSALAFTLRNATVSDGVENDFSGGGLYNSGTANIIGSTFYNNSSTSSGGGIANDGTLTITDSTFAKNTATSDGGGLANYGTVTIVNSTFYNNNANGGGGLINNGGMTTILNSTFSGNSAVAAGGAIATWQGGVTPPVTTVYNTIMASSVGPDDCYNGYGAGTLTGSHNIIETTASGSSSCASITSSTLNPNLGALSGSPWYLPLNIGSPAIDAGDDAICAAAPVNNTSQNGVTRPQGAHCDIGAYEKPLNALTLNSIGANDGWILESSETSKRGGTMNRNSTTLRVGDEVGDKQYRSILHFDTSGLPDDATIVSVQLKLMKQGVKGRDPFLTHLNLLADIKTPSFRLSALQLADFQTAASQMMAGIFSSTPVSGWYTTDLPDAAYGFVNLTSTTQFRIRFFKGDNDDNGADYIKFFSGNSAIMANRPQLIVQYYLP